MKMRLEYFKIIETLLDYNVYIKIYTDVASVPIIEVIKFDNNGEQIIMKSDLSKSVSKNILDLIHEMSTRLNGGIPPFPQYVKKSINRKTLDNVLALDYQIYFYKLIDDRILATVSKFCHKDVYDIFITTNSTMKEAFEALDAEIERKYGFFPNMMPEDSENIGTYAKKMILERRKKEASIKPYRGEI